MQTFKRLSVEATLAAVMFTFAVTARTHAQTATPTSTPPPTATATFTATNTPATCKGTIRVQLTWFAKSPSTAQLNLSGTQCGVPPACDTGPIGSTVTVPPLAVTVTDSKGHSLGLTISEDGVNTRGCPGIDNYAPAAGRLRFVYGAKTTVVGKLQLPLPAPTPPALPMLPVLTPPVTLTIQDGNGYTLQRTMTTCFSNQSTQTASIKCF